MALNVLYLHASADLYGSDLLLYEIVSNLDSTKYSPRVILPDEGPLVALLSKNNIPVGIKKLPVLRRKYFTLAGVSKFSMTFLCSTITLISTIKKCNIHLIHTNTSAVWGGGIAARLCRIPHVSSVMELVEEPLFVAKAMSLMATLFSDKVVAVSEAVKNHFIKLVGFGKHKYEVIPTPVNEKKYRFSESGRKSVRLELGIDDKVVVVGMAARLNRWKGQDVFVQACANVINEIGQKKRVHFIIMGEPLPGQEYFKEEMLKAIENLGLSSCTTVPGYKTNFVDWLSAMDVYVLPSKWPEPNSSGVIAAMAVGLPVIGTNIGGTPEVVIHEQTGLLVPPDDPEAMAKAMLRLIENHDERKRMGNEAKKRAMKLYSLTSYIKRIESIYDSLID